MSVPFKGFCGPSYQLQNKYATIERTINWYLSPNESHEETKFTVGLEPCPGNKQFGTLPVPAPFNVPARGLIELRGRCIGVNGAVVFSIDINGHYIQLGIIANDGSPVSMVANGSGQLFIASAQQGYVLPPNGGPGSLVNIATADFLGASYATFQDDYIIVLTPNSNQFQISGSQSVPLGDATLWDASNVSVQAGQADLLAALISTREYLYLFGNRRSQVYYNIGTAGIGSFPFQSYNETFIETGLLAPAALVELTDSLVWIGQDKRGVRAAYRMTSFQPQRISTFAVERIWQTYTTLADCVAFPYIWNGHQFIQFTFPSAIESGVRFPLGAPVGAFTKATWVYDVTASQILGYPVWTERAYQTALGYAQGRAEMYHCYCYGLHLVSSDGTDGNPGAVYQYAAQPYDCGADINGAQTHQSLVCERICPHLWDGNKRILYNRIEFELARGVGLDSGVFGSNPQLLLRWSDDGGNTWKPERNLPIGKIGQYSLRVHYDRCGYARDRVFWIRCADPVYNSLVGAELDFIVCG